MTTGVSWKDLCDTGQATSKLLFRMCLETFVKELMKLMGTQCFAIHTVSLEHIDIVSRFFHNIGIRVVLRSSDCETSSRTLNLKDIAGMPENLPLQEYKLIAETMGRRHELYFECFHNPAHRRLGELR